MPTLCSILEYNQFEVNFNLLICVTARKKYFNYIKQEENNIQENIRTIHALKFEGERLGGGGGNWSPFRSDVEPPVKLLIAK